MMRAQEKIAVKNLLKDFCVGKVRGVVLLSFKSIPKGVGIHI